MAGGGVEACGRVLRSTTSRGPRWAHCRVGARSAECVREGGGLSRLYLIVPIDKLNSCEGAEHPLTAGEGVLGRGTAD